MEENPLEHPKHHSPVFGLGFIVFSLMVMLIFAVVIFQKPSGSPSGDIGFQAYKPSVMFGRNTSVNEKVVLIKEAGLDYEHYSYQLTYKPENIHLYQEDVGEFADIIAICSPDTSLNADYRNDCDVKPIKSGGRYAVQMNYYQDELFDISAEALIGKTKIWIIIPEKLISAYTTVNWQKYFDSMKPVDTSTAPMNTEVHKQGGGWLSFLAMLQFTEVK